MATSVESSTELLRNYVGGSWTEAQATETQEVRNPATDEVLARVPLSGATDVDVAVSAAAATFPAWRATPPAERARYQLVVRDLAAARAELAGRGVEVGEPQQIDARDGGTFAFFTDPDGNPWALQEVRVRVGAPL